MRGWKTLLDSVLQAWAMDDFYESPAACEMGLLLSTRLAPEAGALVCVLQTYTCLTYVVASCASGRRVVIAQDGRTAS